VPLDDIEKTAKDEKRTIVRFDAVKKK